MARVLVTSEQDIRDALQNGDRWLVLQDHPIAITSQINLDSYSATGPLTLRIEGGGPNMGNLIRKNDISIFRTVSSTWRLYFSHVFFINEPGNLSTRAICQFGDVEDSLFVNCGWSEGGGNGLVIGDSTTNTGYKVRFINSHFTNNGRYHEGPSDTKICDELGSGLVLHGVGNFTMIGGVIERNTNFGVLVRGASGAARIGTVMGVHFEDNGICNGDHEWGLWVVTMRLVRVVNSYFWASRIKLQSDTQECLIENCYFHHHSASNPQVVDHGTNNTEDLNLLFVD